MEKQSRLENLKQLRAEEQASKNPAYDYINDLTESIKGEERAIKRGSSPYQMVS